MDDGIFCWRRHVANNADGLCHRGPSPSRFGVRISSNMYSQRMSIFLMDVSLSRLAVFFKSQQHRLSHRPVSISTWQKPPYKERETAEILASITKSSSKIRSLDRRLADLKSGQCFVYVLL